MVNLVGKRVALTSTQKIPTFEINDRIVLQPHTWYTCPAGKKALVKGNVKCTGRGAAAVARFEAAGISMFEWDRAVAVNTNASGDSYIEIPDNLATGSGGQTAFFDIELSAGDIIETTQDAGTNAEFEVFAKVQETSI